MNRVHKVLQLWTFLIIGAAILLQDLTDAQHGYYLKGSLAEFECDSLYNCIWEKSCVIEQIGGNLLLFVPESNKNVSHRVIACVGVVVILEVRLFLLHSVFCLFSIQYFYVFVFFAVNPSEEHRNNLQLLYQSESVINQHNWVLKRYLRAIVKLYYYHYWCKIFERNWLMIQCVN